MATIVIVLVTCSAPAIVKADNRQLTNDESSGKKHIRTRVISVFARLNLTVNPCMLQPLFQVGRNSLPLHGCETLKMHRYSANTSHYTQLKEPYENTLKAVAARFLILVILP